MLISRYNFIPKFFFSKYRNESFRLSGMKTENIGNAIYRLGLKRSRVIVFSFFFSFFQLIITRTIKRLFRCGKLYRIC